MMLSDDRRAGDDRDLVRRAADSLTETPARMEPHCRFPDRDSSRWALPEFKASCHSGPVCWTRSLWMR